MRFGILLALLVPYVLAKDSLQPVLKPESVLESEPADPEAERDSSYIEGDIKEVEDTTGKGHPIPVEFPEGHDVVHPPIMIEDSEDLIDDNKKPEIPKPKEVMNISSLKIPDLKIANKTTINNVKKVVMQLQKSVEEPKKTKTKGKHKQEKKIHIVLDDIIKSIESAFVNYKKGEDKIVVGYKGTRDKKIKGFAANTQKFDDRLKNLQTASSKAASVKALAGDKFTETKKALNTATGKVNEAKTELKKAQTSESNKKAAAIKVFNGKMSDLFKVALRDKSSYCEEYKFIEKLRGYVEKLNVDYTHVNINDWKASKNKRCRYRSCPKDPDLPNCMVSGKFATALDCGKHCIAQSWCLAFEWSDSARGKRCYIYTNLDNCKKYSYTGYHIYQLPSYKSLGCYVDKSTRAIPQMLWGDSKKTIKNCADDVKAKGYSTFGFQHNSQCFTGKDGTFKYDKYGKSTGCSSSGRGGSWANNVYQVTEKGFVSKLVTECSKCYCDGGEAASGTACDKPLQQKCSKCTIKGLKLTTSKVCLAYYPFAKKDYTLYRGYWYASLGGNSRSFYGRSMVDYGGYRCGSGWVTMPTGWSLAPDNWVSRNVIKAHYWYTACPVTSSGRSYYTKRYGSYWKGRSCGCCHLRRSGNRYRVSSCNRVVLIRMKKPS